MENYLRKNLLEKFNSYFEHIYKFAVNIGLGIGMITLTILAWKEYHKNSYILEEFHVPKNFEENGYTGLVIATQIFDKFNDMKNAVSSLKEDNANFSNSAQMPDMDIEVIGMGISIQATVEYFKAILGNPSKHLSGEITQQDSSLTLHLRITGKKTAVFRAKTANKNLSFNHNTLKIKHLAKFNFKTTSPKSPFLG